MKYDLPNAFDHYEVQVDGLTIHYVREGKGQPLLLWHGWPGFWWDWRYVIKPLSQHFDVIVPDFRGCGQSDKTDFNDLGKYSLAQLADDQAKFIDALGLEDVRLIAHDYGSMVAHKFLRKYPDKISKALLLDPVTPAFTESPLSPDDWYLLFSETEIAQALIGYNRDTIKIFYGYIFKTWTLRHPLLSEEEMEIMTDNYMIPGNVMGGICYDRANIGPNANPWDDIDSRVYGKKVDILWAKQDPSIQVSARVNLPKYYSNYTLELLDDCGHFVMIEKPDAVIKKALNSLQ